MSLFLQLVDSCRLVSPAELQGCMPNLDPTDLRSVCDAFDWLVQKLDEIFKLYVVIDGLEFFAEPARRCAEMMEIVRRLRALCRGPLQANMKLLFTSPT